MSRSTPIWLPGARAARTYERRWLLHDVVAGVVLAAILVPQGIAYAELAGLPAVTGLYTTVACLLGYAVFGPSRVLVLGPDSSIAPLILAAVTPLLLVGDDPGKAIALAGMLAVLVGLIEIALGLGRLGFVADLLSKEVQIGYMNGLAVIIIVNQLPKLCGFSTDADSFPEEIRAFLSGFDQTNPTTLTVGLAVLAVLVVLPKMTSKLPAILVAVVGVLVASAAFGLSDHGVATVGALPQGVPTPSLPWTGVSDVFPLLVAAVGITFVSLADTITTATSFAARRGEEVDADQEMVGLGASNIAAAMFQGFAVSTSGSRTAVAEQSGARTQLAGVIGAGLVVALLVFLNSLLAGLPQSALAAVVIVAALSLLDVQVLFRVWRVRRGAVIVSVVATAGVIFLGVTDGVAGWHSLAQHPEAQQRAGIVVYRWEAPLFFANAGIFRRQVRELADDASVRYIVLQCEAITDVDVTAAAMLGELDDELNAAGVHLAFAELRDRVQDLVKRYGLMDTLDADHFYPTIEVAVAAVERKVDGRG